MMEPANALISKLGEPDMSQLLSQWLTRTCLGLLLFATFIAQPTAAQGADKLQPEQLVYKLTTDAKGNEVKLQLHLFKPAGWSADDQRPVVVCFFGGGWVSGNPDQFFPQCRDLAARGMVAISAEYRIKSKHGTTPVACVEDGKSAIRYVRAHAKELGIDPQRIVAAGGSAGGHVAACTGIIKGFEAESEDHAISSVPNLMVLFNPVLDVTGKPEAARQKGIDDPQLISPMQHIHKDQPASLIVHGEEDTTVSIDSIRRFVKRCEEVQASSKLVAYEGAGHGFFNHSSFRKPKDGAPDYYTLTMKEVVAFLAKHDYVKGEDE